ncbi:phosducin-like protein isoform X2 [Hydra vulgaris]|uniref:Phosducin-like protein isoform X2 n=2 Tax=Hydra vulgaris TaxID=6087 RepID=A0ABM4C1W6_HYDVU
MVFASCSYKNIRLIITNFDIQSMENLENEEEKNLTRYSYSSTAPQTGPKGVIADYRRHSAVVEHEKEVSKLKYIEEVKKKSFIADPNKFANVEEEPNKHDIKNGSFDDDDEDFLKNYHKKRLHLLEKESKNNGTKYSKLFDMSGEDLLEKIENPCKDEILVVHLYDPKVSACVTMNKCFEYLAVQYPYIQFTKVLAKKAGLSLNFQMKALPTIQVYKDGNLIGNFFNMQDKLDTDFHPSDVENFLLDSNMLTEFQS